MKKLFITFFLTLLFMSGVRAQQVIEIKPLFEYPVAPDELESLQDKCNYLVKVFWDKFNFKSKEAIDQYALNEAFQVYVTAFQFAGAKEVENSVDKLIKDLSGNPMMLLQFGKAAEENLYGPRAEFWSDAIYLKFLDAILKNKKISPQRKVRYADQAAALRESAPGEVAPTFWFENPDRASKQYFPMSTPTMLIFGNPDATDWRLSRIKIDSNYAIEEALQKGKINILFIIPEDIDGWANMVTNYNKRWTVGQSIDAKKHYDLRLSPSIFIVGADGKITRKNLSLDEAQEAILELAN